MPNHITNIIISEHDLSPFITDGGFDFEKILPMPKILHEITSPVRLVDNETMIDSFKELAVWQTNPSQSFIKPSVKISQSFSEELIEKYGYNNWYGWAVANWGTKWNAYDYIKTGRNKIIGFNTAWASPLLVFQEMAKILSEQVEIICKDEGDDHVLYFRFSPTGKQVEEKVVAEIIIMEDNDDSEVNFFTDDERIREAIVDKLM